MQCHFNSVIDSSGNAINGATVSVYKPDLVTLATIYSDEGITLASNPITCDLQGRFYFFAGNGKYALKISGPGITTYWIKGVCLFDPSIILSPTPLSLINSFVAVIGLQPQIIRVGDTVNISGTMKGGAPSTTFAYIPSTHIPANGYLDFSASNFSTGSALSISLVGTSLIINGSFLTSDIILFGLSYQAAAII